jgi:hypothetical protein
MLSPAAQAEAETTRAGYLQNLTFVVYQGASA